MNTQNNLIKLFFLCSLLFFLKGNAQPNNDCWDKVRACGNLTMLITPSLQHWAVGSNGTGVYGTGQFYTYYIPTQGVTSTWADLQTSSLFALAIKTNGTLWGWGSNYYYSLASTTTNMTLAPTQIGTANNWSKISTGNDYALAIKSDGTLWGWGHNNFHQLGIGSTTNLSTIAQLGTDTNWSKISAGLEGSLAIKTDGTLWGWGHNSQSSLGVASPLEINTITQIGTANDWKEIEHQNGYYAVGLKTDGTLWAAGHNTHGQLGDNTTTTRTSFVKIGTDTDWKSIATGYYTTYAIKNNGTLWAWGNNQYGQVGDGTNTHRYVPTQIGTDTNWESITAGNYHAAALKTDGSLYTWGLNIEGQLGDGTQNNKNTPTLIACPYNNLNIENQTFTNNFSIYPNPAQNTFTIETVEAIKKITAHDVLGKQIEVNPLSNQQYFIEKPGVYLLTIELDNNQIITKKLIIQ
jgi:alpha-tubulin suppressor-like RCC1 family protein